MSLKPFSGPRGLPHPRKTKLEFDFVIAERPKYIPGSGPPLAPVLQMPAHDKDGYIIEEVTLFAELRYLVGYEKQPHLRVSVKLSNILDWVSPWALEQYHIAKYDAQEREREAIELPLIEAKEERRRKRMEKLSRDGKVSGTGSRKRKRTPIPDQPSNGKKPAGKSPDVRKRSQPTGPGRRNQPVEQEVSFTSPKQSQHSQLQPSLASPGGVLANRTALDSESEDEDTEMALEYQLNGGRVPAHFDPSRTAGNFPPSTSKRNAKPRSTSKPLDESREESPSENTLQKNPRYVPSILSRKNAVAATSSREALKAYESHERKMRTPNTLADKYSYTRKPLKIQTFKGAHVGLAGPSRSVVRAISDDKPEEQEKEEDVNGSDEEEYEIERILDDEERFTKKGEEEVWYLIKWVGDWDNTWEPAENVAKGAIKAYWDKKRKKHITVGHEEDSDPESLFVSDRKGKGQGKEAMRGELIDDDDDDDDDTMS